MSVDGNHILYHYLQKQLRQSNIWLFQMLVTRLIADLAIWFSPTLYSHLPILLPHVVRDSKCRPRKKGDPDEWGFPDSQGYCRDDNSLVKSLPRALDIRSPSNPLYDRKRLSKGFVASHIWRSSDIGMDDQRCGWTNSFIPNLVWLPSQLAKLTDRAGSFAQCYLQALSYRIYRGHEVSTDLQPFVNSAWEQLPEPTGMPAQGLPREGDLSFFQDSPAFIKRRTNVIAAVCDHLAAIRQPAEELRTLRPRKYSEGLQEKRWHEVQELHERLSKYLHTVAT